VVTPRKLHIAPTGFSACEAGARRRFATVRPDVVNVSSAGSSLLEPRVNLETLSARWRGAFDATEDALVAARFDLAPETLRAWGDRLREERATTAHIFEGLARQQGVTDRFVHLMIPRAQLRRMLGLPPDLMACVFNLEDVLISPAVHVAAWAETFDQFIFTRVERTGGGFAPFNPLTDYRLYLDARPRLEGVRAFLASRGISLPDGKAADAPGTETVYGLANLKNHALLRRLDRQGVTASVGARRYIELVREVGVRSAVVSASANTQTMLERAGLATLIEGRVDGNEIDAEQLRAKPSPDTLLAACKQLAVAPQQAAAFETTPAGVAAARAGGFELIVGVDRSGLTDALRAQGADLVVPGLAELLERNLDGHVHPLHR
jgi:HAD superfamily hydrolase (TIGR01509 family)